MKYLKQSFKKRVFVFILCTMVLSSTVFFSYDSTMVVQAVDYSDLLIDAAIVCFSGLGLVMSGPTLGAVISILGPEMTSLGKDVYDYVTENEDGTTTISEDFVNLVLQAYKEYKEDNGEKFDGTMLPDDYGYYHYDSLSGIKFWKPNDSVNMTITYTDINTNYPCAAIVYSNRFLADRNYIHRAFLVFYNKSLDSFYTTIPLVGNVPPEEESFISDIGISLEGAIYLNEPHFVRRYIVSGNTESGDDYPINLSASGFMPQESYIEVSSSSIPVYHDLSSLKEGLRSGDFSAAWNYGKVSEGETSSYTGIYEGGDITVNTEKLDGISDKLAELEESNNNIEDILKAILEWLELNGGGSGSGGGGNVTVNIDLSTTNSWLSKIYEKVCQIYDKMNSAVEAAEDAALANIQESLDEIIEQLKKIKHWAAVDTVIDGVDAVADWLDLIRDVLTDGAGSAVAALSSALQDSTDLMKQKFPFSIPWDILFLVSALSAEPETPQFSIPFNFEISGLDLAVDYQMELDFTQLQWLSDLSRLLLSLTYAAGLMKKTVDIVSANKEG